MKRRTLWTTALVGPLALYGWAAPPDRTPLKAAARASSWSGTGSPERRRRSPTSRRRRPTSPRSAPRSRSSSWPSRSTSTTTCSARRSRPARAPTSCCSTAAVSCAIGRMPCCRSRNTSPRTWIAWPAGRRSPPTATLRSAGHLAGPPDRLQQDAVRADRARPRGAAATWSDFLEDSAAITEATGARCFAMGNKEGYGIQFFLSGLGSGVLTTQEYDAWIAGDRDWTSPGVKRSSNCGARPRRPGPRTRASTPPRCSTTSSRSLKPGRPRTSSA